MRHTAIATLDPLIPLVNADFAADARDIAKAHTDDAGEYLYLRGCAHTGRYPFLHALVVDRRTMRIEVMTVKETRGPGSFTTWLECTPLTIDAARREFENVDLKRDFDRLSPHLSERLDDAIAVDGPIIAEALAAVERALAEASTHAGAAALRNAEAALRL